MICLYCRRRPAIHIDHIVSKDDRRRYGIAKDDERYHAQSCGECNWTKLTRRLVPSSKAELVDELNALMTGTRWRVWSGDAETLRGVAR